MSAGGGNRAVIAALIANLGIAVLKFAAYLLTRSSSMLAESIHSVADSGNQILLLVGGRAAARQASEEHPFGYGRNRYIYAFIVAIVLFSVGGLFALYEAYHKWHDPHPIEGRWWWVPLAVLVGAIALETRSFWVAIHESMPLKRRQSWVRFVRTAKSPELPVILLEDLGALVGLVLALIGVGLTLLTDDGRWDAAGTASIGILLVIIAAILAIETKSLLLGESATRENVATIRAALEGNAECRIIHMKTLHLGPEEVLVAAKIAVPDTSSAEAVVAQINAAELRVRTALPIARVIYIEPDIEQANYQSTVPPLPHARSGH